MVTEATLNKNAGVLLKRYVDLYLENYGSLALEFNRYRDKWVFRDMLDDLGKETALKVIEFYFKTPHRGHPVKLLGSRYDHFHRVMLDLEADREERLRLREETKRRVKEWDEKIGNA